MRRQLLCLLSFILLTAASVVAQTPLENVFPERFGRWKASSSAVRVKATSEQQLKVLTESGLVGMMARQYFLGQDECGVRLYEMRDPSGAYEALTHLSQPQDSETELFQVGNFVVATGCKQRLSETDQLALAGAVRAKADTTPLPPLRSYLPASGRVAKSERYVLGPVGFGEAAKSIASPDAGSLVDQAGFNSGAEAIFAKYKSGKDEATLLLIEYPTPQLAELHLKHMQRAILVMKNGASVERKGSLLSIVLAPTSQEYAEKLRSGVNYETQLTWSEPSATATDPPIMSTVVKIFIATGVFMVVTFVIGIAFGGVRIITKRLFPGKVFDRKSQIEVLQLGLSGKPIDPTDLY